MSLRTPGRIVLLLFAVTGMLLAACTDPIVVGSIPPSSFQFTPVVPRSGPGAGGWKVAQVIILLGRLSPRYPETALCDIEVGVPEALEDRWIATASAQAAAAEAADEAARRVLKKRLPTAVACDEFRTTMQSIMIDPTRGNIPGTRVRRFQQAGIPQTTFP